MDYESQKLARGRRWRESSVGKGLAVQSLRHTHLKGKGIVVVLCVIPALGRQGEMDPWDSLASHLT